MSTIQIQKNWLDEFARVLRTTKFEQIQFQLSFGKNGRCAIGVIAERLECMSGITEDTINLIVQAYGVDRGILNDILYLNDSGSSFEQIADWLEKIADWLEKK